MALRVGETLPVPVQFDPGKLVDPREMSRALVLSSLLEDWCKQVRRSITKAAVEEGTDIPGFSVRSRAGSHEVTEVYEAVQTILGRYPSDLTMIMQACSLSIPRLTDVIAAATGGTKKATREELLDVLKFCTIQKDPVVYLQRNKGITNEEIIQG
jgi:hypothetical protein